jgi:carbon-monoxide dehydrogenase medium subunit
MTATLHQPRDLREACEMLSSLDDPMVYGGGTAIQILVRQGLLFVENLVDVSRVTGLDELRRTATGLRVGSVVSLRRMETDQVVRGCVPLASETYGHVANPRVRNTATVGGNLAHGDYRLDPPTALMALGALLEIASVGGTRHLPLREFFVDLQLTALRPGELITAIEIPAQPAGASGAFVKLSSLGANDWPAASAAALLVAEESGPRTLRLGLGALAPVPLYCEVDLTGLPLAGALDAARAAAEAAMDPIADVRGSVAYKRRLGLVAVEDAVRAAWKGWN